ncbi:hypothetical protein AB1Y20_011644 [Prymnesium parvum]|uniref:Uncharacterized protein n=1 Tax=Prymnesium parvum TaxID=97485 RepID=A0AB34IH46_PRYPA
MAREALYTPPLHGGGLSSITPGLLQVWYSESTLAALAREVEHAQPRRLACLSCPSVYFWLREKGSCAASNFEYDRRWGEDTNFVFFDCYSPDDVDPSLHAQFDFLIADPPSLQLSVLENYATVIRRLAAPGAKILFSTFDSFFPTIGRWCFYSNFKCVALCVPNDELSHAVATDEPDESWADGFHMPQHEI